MQSPTGAKKLLHRVCTHSHSTNRWRMVSSTFWQKVQRLLLTLGGFIRNKIRFVYKILWFNFHWNSCNFVSIVTLNGSEKIWHHSFLSTVKNCEKYRTLFGGITKPAVKSFQNNGITVSPNVWFLVTIKCLPFYSS